MKEAYSHLTAIWLDFVVRSSVVTMYNHSTQGGWMHCCSNVTHFGVAGVCVQENLVLLGVDCWHVCFLHMSHWT